MPGHVLIPLDGSPFGELALPYATTIADRTSWSLHLVHVRVPDPRDRLGALPDLPPTVGTPSAPRVDPLRAERSYLRAVARRLGLPTEAAAALRGEDGVAAAIGRYAAELESPLVVMSTHGRTGLDRLWMGSVADALVRAGRAPVLLVRPDRSDGGRPGLSGVERVLVPLDAGGVGEAVLEPLVELGRRLGWRLCLLHVVSTRLLLGARPYPVRVEDVELRRRRGREYLRGVARRLRERGAEVSMRVAEARTPPEGILRVAVQDRMDLVGMATHGRGGLTRAILGSVADRLLADCSLPLILAQGGEPTVH